jgi:hypothetical protein
MFVSILGYNLLTMIIVVNEMKNKNNTIDISIN